MRVPLTCLALLAFGMALGAEDETATKAREAVDGFKKAYASKEESLRVAAVPILGDPAHPLTIKALASLLTSDTDPVRVTAAETLAHFTGRKDVAPVLGSALAANAGHVDVEKAIVTALGQTDDAAAAPVLEKFVKEMIPKRDIEDFASEQAAVEALGKLRCKAAVEALLDLLQRNATSGKARGDGHHRSKERVSNACKKTLNGLFGTQNQNWREWKDWWEDNAKLYDDRLNKQ